jgi:hypothetical protein
MRRAAVLILVSMTGLTICGCKPKEPIPSTGTNASVDGVSPGHMMAINPSILEDQRAFYTKHEAPAAPTAEATTTPATQPTTAPATQS